MYLKLALYACVFYLYSLDLRRLDNRRLCSLDDTMDLNCLSIGKLNQRYCGTRCLGVACCHGYLKFRSDVLMVFNGSALMIYDIQNG